MERTKKIVRTSITGIIVNVILVGFKAAIGFISGSVAIITDAMNNLSDVLSSTITIVGTKLSARKPDKKHPYGHGRIEYVTSALISAIVLLTGALSFKESIEKIITPAEVEYGYVSAIIIVAAIGAKIALGIYFKKTGKKLSSGALEASGTDALSDALLSGGTLVAVIVNMIFGVKIEGWVGVVISVFIIRTGIQIIKETLDSIIGTRADKDLTEEIKAKLCGYEDVYGCYDLALHNYGPDRLIGSAHIEVPEDMPASRVHKLTRKIAVDIYQQFGIVMTIGIYATNEGEKAKQIRETLDGIAANYPEILQIHGFYLEEDQKSVTFDLVMDFKADGQAVCADIVKQMTEKYPDLSFNVVLDSDYSD
ncbi:MAG: cation transporter [Clostridia bacterium]|nr:cation transporter [Clostridia bacterium]